jgi:hypothetical protein
VVQAQGGQSGEVDGASSGHNVGQDAFLPAAAGFSTAPGATGEVADLAFRYGPMRPVILLPVRIPLARFGVLQSGFLRVDTDHPSPTGFGAGRAQRAGPTQRAESGDAVAQASPDGHGVLSRAGNGAGGHIDPELIFRNSR